MEVCDGGGAREDELEGAGRRLGRGEREGGGISEDAARAGTGPRRGGARAPPDARWAELIAGNEGAGGESSSLKAGMEDEVEVEADRGVVGDDLKMGGGGGGMAFRSSSAFPFTFTSRFISQGSSSRSLGSFVSSWIVVGGLFVMSMEGRRNHSSHGR